MQIKKLLFLAGVFSVNFLAAEHAERTQPTVITNTELTDLELLTRSTGAPGGILPIIDRTITKFGQEAFATILSNPITDIAVLQKRQAIIQKLQNPALAAVLGEQLSIIKQHEAKLNRCFNPAYRDHFSIALKKSYFQFKEMQRLNQSALALDLINSAEFLALFEPVLHHALLHGLFNSCDHHSHKAATGTIQRMVQDFVANMMDRLGSAKPYVENAILYGHGAMTVANVVEMAQHLYHKSGVINTIHQEIISVYACIRAAATISELLEGEDLISADVNADSLVTLANDNYELVAESLNSRFSTKTKNNILVFSRVGPTLAAYEKLGKKSHLISKIMRAAGAVDALLGIGKLINEDPEKYTFAEYRPGNIPYIYLENFVHPQLIENSKVHNSFTFSKETNTDKLVITGPNASGKSSNTKTVVVNLVLAQTLGFLLATKGIITPMSRIITYINIQDNLGEGKSAFKAERERTNKIIAELSQLNGNAPSIILLDDSLFRTTQPTEGEIAAYKFVKKICSLESTLALVVTHFEQLTKLEDETNGRVQNYHIGLETDSRGFITSTYKLKRGISPRDAIFSIVGDQDYYE